MQQIINEVTKCQKDLIIDYYYCKSDICNGCSNLSHVNPNDILPNRDYSFHTN